MKIKFTNNEIILSHLFLRIALKKDDIIDVSIPEDYAPSNALLIGSYLKGKDTVMLHTKKQNYYFYIDGDARMFVKKVEDFLQGNLK
ncbi:hypothetical protein FNE58_21020 [Bacillus thuringiensis]|uniref:SunI/YnzG family protein n=1 Tax=Bacillus thuringiensis TaxID=1428 RepID=UPI000AAA6C19|nr:hypothetical protein [Bacillus thuringiensis]MCU5606882.1 hypothetical protein [Bacillus cereus]MDR5041908.1 hypothetical protein [Bacillus thuringiensis]